MIKKGRAKPSLCIRAAYFIPRPTPEGLQQGPDFGANFFLDVPLLTVLTVFLAAVFFAAVVFFAVVFLAVVFLAVVFFVAVFLAAVFLAGALAAAFLIVFFIYCPPL
jgi:hypothetical protein